ncbi:MAG: phosphotransferase family protein [Candidatus Kariarchaeaceae archaeon]
MEIQGKVILDIQNILNEHLPKDQYTIKDGFSKILGGADTEIFSFTIEMKDESNSYELILRIYRKGATINSSKREFDVLDKLFKAGLSVPKPYGFIGPDNSLNRPFLIMEKVDGGMLSEEFFKENSDPKTMLVQFIQNLVKIHNINWKIHFSDRTPPDIESDPYYIIKQLMRNPKDLIEKYDIKEFKPLIAWLENSIQDHPSNEVVLVHGDYHGMNVIVRGNGDLVTIDWNDVKLGDRRQDLAFSIVATDSAMEIPMKDSLVTLYENIAERKIEGLEYFMVLSVLVNFIRVYSMLFNYEITGENDMTRDRMIGEYRPFVIYFVNMIKEITSLDFPQIEEKLNMKK